MIGVGAFINNPKMEPVYSTEMKLEFFKICNCKIYSKINYCCLSWVLSRKAGLYKNLVYLTINWNLVIIITNFSSVWNEFGA